MLTITTFLVLAAGTSTQEAMDAADSCELGETYSGIPSRLANVLDEEDLPALVTETTEIALGVYTLDLGDGDFLEYEDWYEVSHTFDVEPAPCALP